jgi:hemerythrin-like metal-binding protein
VSGLAWSHACIVGVKAMDDQHGILVDTLNELRQQLLRGDGREQVNQHMERLIEFITLHFGCEESLLDRFDFPGLEEHREAHEQLLNNIRLAASYAENDEKTAFQRQLSLLSDSYLLHIEVFDRQYGSWLNDLGIY